VIEEGGIFEGNIDMNTARKRDLKEVKGAGGGIPES